MIDPVILDHLSLSNRKSDCPEKNSDITLGQASLNVNLFYNFSFFQHRIPSWPGLHIWPLLFFLAKHDHVLNHQVPHHDWCRHFPMRKLNAIKDCREKKSCNCLKRNKRQKCKMIKWTHIIWTRFWLEWHSVNELCVQTPKYPTSFCRFYVSPKHLFFMVTKRAKWH